MRHKSCDTIYPQECQWGQLRTEKEDRLLSTRLSAGDKTTTAAGAVISGQTEDAKNPLLSLILTSLEDDKAEDVVAINLVGKSEMADHMIIATGRSSRQVSAMAEHLVDRLKSDMDRLCRVEGKDAGDWVLIDCGDAVVHLFRPEVREFYQLEKLWAVEGTQGQAANA